MTQEALKLALEALITASGHVNNEAFVKVMMARDAVVEALAQPEQEPVGQVVNATDKAFECKFVKILPIGTKLYTHSQRTWVGLTDEEIDSYFEDHGWSPSENYYPVIKDIEAKLKEKNT